MTRWNLDPVLAAGLAAAFIYLWRATETPDQRRCLGSAVVLAVIMFVSPFCALTSALFSVRVTHHVLLTAVLAPLIVHALPAVRTRWSGSLAVWTGLQAFAFWIWHAPGAYAAALSNDLVYWSMQATLVGTAAGFWAALRRANSPAAIGALLAATVLMGLLGALITFAGTPLYAPHYLTTGAWSMTPLEDQQLAGMLMALEQAVVFFGVFVYWFFRFLAEEERREDTDPPGLAA